MCIGGTFNVDSALFRRLDDVQNGKRFMEVEGKMSKQEKNGIIKFKVTDNYGKSKIVEYEWNPEHGIPDEETILEEAEECTCSLNESVSVCEGDCIMYDNGKVELLSEEL